MRIFITLFLILIFSCVFHPSAYATSDQAHKDYLYQFDGYRTSLNEFKVAKDQYMKFKTLISQTTALEKTKTMLEKRDMVLRAYLLFLDEKLSETSALSATNVSLYKTLLQNEITFLDKHTTLIQSIGSIEDAKDVSRQLVSHYSILRGTIQQTIVALTFGELQKIDTGYADILINIQLVIQKYRTLYTPEKQSTVDRWLLQIQNKRSLFAQKIDQIQTLSSNLKNSTSGNINDSFIDIQKKLNEAKQYQLEGVAFIKELVELLKYSN